MSFSEAEVLLSELHVDPENNARKDYGDIDQLKARIRALGLWGRIHVSAIEDEGDGVRYTLENGYRRVTAVTLLVLEGTTHADTGQDLRQLKAQVLPAAMTDVERAELMFSLNTTQKRWTPYEQAMEIDFLLKNGSTLADIGARLALGDLAVRQRLALLTAPDFVQDALAKNDITATHARAILRVPDEEGQRELVKAAASGDVGTREIEAKAEALVEKAVAAGAPAQTRGRKKKAKPEADAVSGIKVRPVTDIVQEIDQVQKQLVEASDAAKPELESYLGALQWVLYDADLSSTTSAEPAPSEVEGDTESATPAEAELEVSANA